MMSENKELRVTRLLQSAKSAINRGDSVKAYNKIDAALNEIHENGEED